MTIIITCSQCGHKDWYVLQQSKAQRKTAKQRGLTGYASVVPNATGAQSWQAVAAPAQKPRKPPTLNGHRFWQSVTLGGFVMALYSTTLLGALGGAKGAIQCATCASFSVYGLSLLGLDSLRFVADELDKRYKRGMEAAFRSEDDDEPQPAKPPSYTLDGEKRRRAQGVSEAKKDKEAFLDFVRIVAARQSDKLPTGSKALRNTALSYQRKITDPFHKQAGEWLIKNGMAKKSGNSWKLTAELAQIEAAAVYLTPPSPDS